MLLVIKIGEHCDFISGYLYLTVSTVLAEWTRSLFQCIKVALLLADLGRMYNLVSRIQDGLGELKKLLETHIHNQGLAAIEKCGEAALNVSTVTLKTSRA